MIGKRSVFCNLLLILFLAFFPAYAARPRVTINAAPTTINLGGSSTLTWTSTNATVASINQEIGRVPVNGSLIVSPTKTTTYKITVRNSSGYRTARAKVTVKPTLPTVTFGAAPTTIEARQSSTLSWTTSNATSVSINQGIGSVVLNGSRTVTPEATTTYTITVTGNSGTVTATATVIVNAGPPLVTFNAAPANIEAGQSSILSWTTTYATSVVIDKGIGSTGLNGSKTVSPGQTTIYTLTATGPVGTTTSQVQVQVQALAPMVTLAVNSNAIQPGESATLSWNSTNADSAIFDNDIGNVELNGSMVVSPATTTTYTITVTGPGGSKTASVNLIVFSGKKCYAYIPDSSDNKIRIIDTDTNTLYKTIEISKTDTSLQGTAAEQSGVFSYIADTGRTRIIKIDPLTMTAAGELSMDANFQGKPKHIAIAPDGCFLYATSSVPMWDPDAGKYVGNICTIKTGGNSMSAIRGVMTDLPHQVSLEGLAVSKDNSRLFVADPDSSQVLVLDTIKLQRWAANMVQISDELITTIPLASSPLEVAFSPDGQTLYAMADSILFEIDALNFTVSRSLAIPSGSRFMKVHPDGSKVYVVTGSYLSIVETAGFTKIATVGITGLYSCSGFDVHPDGSRIFLVEKTYDKLITIDASAYQVLSTIALGTTPTAHGNFLSYLPITIAGNVKQDGSGLSGVTITLDGEGILRTKQTAASGDFLFGLKAGNYQLTPTISNLAFIPENMDLQVSENMIGLDFVVSGIVEPPTVTLTSSSTWVKQYESFTLTWSSSGAEYVTIEVATSDHLPPSGSCTFALQSTTTIWGVAYNRGGSASASVKVYVAYTDPPTASISASPTSIQQGSSSTLTWSTTKSSTVTIDNGIGTVASSGSKVVSPTATTTYTITTTHSSGYQVSANATVTVSLYNTSAVLTGTISDFATSQPLAEVTVSALDASGIPKTTLTGTDGKYTISGLRVGDITVSFINSGYDLYQQTINIPANTTFDLATQLHQTLVGATLRGVVKEGQTNLPIAGATVTATYSGSSQTSTSASDGSYILTCIPLGTSTTITASYTSYLSKSTQQTFSQAQVYVWDFFLYDASAVATINGKLTNAKTMQPEEGVEVTFEGSNLKVTTAADGNFIFTDIPLGEQTFYFNKVDYIDESITFTIDRTPFDIDLIKPNRDSGQISIGQSINGVVQDAVSQKPLSGAIVRVPGLGLEAQTDADGNFQLTGLPIGNYPIIVIATNHMALNFMASVNIDETNRADFALIPLANGLIKGIVTDVATGEPVAGASIEIAGSTMLAATSEGDGTYKMIGVPPGTFKILATHSEYTDEFVDNVEVQDLSSTTINLLLNKRPTIGALAGRILDNATGDPVSGATITVIGTAIMATTDAGGNYLLENVPAGLNDIIVSASNYPDSPRTRAVIADKDLSSPSTTSSDIRIDISSSTVDEAVTTIITASEGGDIITQDSRFLLHIFPGTLSTDARITLKDASDGPTVPIGSDLPLDPALGIEGIKAASLMTQIEISSVNEGDPAPTIDGLAAFAVRYAQKDTDAFQLDESTAFTYSWNGTYFTALDPRPYELAVDRVNNIVYSVIDLSKTIAGSTMQQSNNFLLKSDPYNGGGIMVSGTSILFKIIGKSIKNTIFPPKPKIKIFDKNELLAVINAPSEKNPNPNALPLLVIHGFDPFFLWYRETNPNNQERYRLMIEDIVDATNGVYRPVFVSYNTEAKIPSIAQSLAEYLLGENLDQNISFKGLPADPNDPDSGAFPYLDTFGFSMGGLVSRTFMFFNRQNKVHNMTMIGTPNHGTFNCLKYLFQNNSLFGVSSNISKPLNFGASDMLDYDDNNPIDGYNHNPFLFRLNSSILSPTVTPQGDMNLFAGTDESAWLGLTNLFIASPHDSLVTVKSVFCRPTNSTLESKLSLLKVHEPISKKYEHIKDFSHANIGKQGKRIRDFSEELVKGFSDWTISREYEDNDPDMLPDNIYVKPTTNVGGYCKSKVKVEYNVWDGSEGRTARDFDRVVLVIYHQDGNGHWHISEPKSGANGTDKYGNLNMSKVEEIQGNSSKNTLGARILSANVNFDPNPPQGDIGYDPEKDIVKVISSVIPLRPGKMTAPLDPTKAYFRIPELGE